MRQFIEKKIPHLPHIYHIENNPVLSSKYEVSSKIIIIKLFLLYLLSAYIKLILSALKVIVPLITFKVEAIVHGYPILNTYPIVLISGSL